MGISHAVIKRLSQICTERNITTYDLAIRSGLTPSTVYSLFMQGRKTMSLTTFKKLCDGLDVSLLEFFDDPLFENLEQELK